MWDGKDFLGGRTQGAAVEVDLVTFCIWRRSQQTNPTRLKPSKLHLKISVHNRVLQRKSYHQPS